MPTVAVRASLVVAYTGQATHAALYVTAPTQTAAGTEVVGSPYARKALTWTPPDANAISTATVTFDVPAGVTPAGTGLHTAATGGAFLDGWPISSSQFPVSGQLVITYVRNQT